MSRTIFWYIFKDLVRVFLMTSGALAGIMSFGGLLRPLTHQGLDIGQVGQVLTYFGPAMTTYSYPIAALFATTVVYGRLAADNELTACRAGGLSLASLSVAGPALVLGLLVASVSLMFLCFVVPVCTLKVEKILYSNMAQLVANRIERNHEIDFGQYTIFAQEAWLPPGSQTSLDHQQVVLRGPTIVTTERPRPAERDFRVPKEFMTASEAIVTINRRPDDEQIYLDLRLVNGSKFPRKFEDAMQAGVEETECGPILVPSPIKEDTKFMDIWRLRALYAHPEHSQRLREIISEMVRQDQSAAFTGELLERLNSPAAEVQFNFDGGNRYILRRDPNAPPAEILKEELVVRPARSTTDATRRIQLERRAAGRPASVVEAGELRLRARPAPDDQQMDCSISLLDCTSQTEDGPAPRANFTQHFNVPMPDAVSSLSTRGLVFYSTEPKADTLRRQMLQLLNKIVAESHDRASFAISCLILVMVGCSLGMIFRSGNILTAFAVSFIPALLSITLTIAGQRIAGDIGPHGDASGPLVFGLGLIWAGNAFNLLLAAGLLWRLHRT